MSDAPRVASGRRRAAGCGPALPAACAGPHRGRRAATAAAPATPGPRHAAWRTRLPRDMRLRDMRLRDMRLRDMRLRDMRSRVTRLHGGHRRRRRPILAAVRARPVRPSCGSSRAVLNVGGRASPAASAYQRLGRSAAMNAMSNRSIRAPASPGARVASTLKSTSMPARSAASSGTASVSIACARANRPAAAAGACSRNASRAAR